ncbi:MAG TPA: T9SS type A sorting domain-containing protein [Candidatus Acidoferrales bacterium]|nr:T9SS type A sorting domain-containing protein [Candidatus Acidoferrales bacterium]
MKRILSARITALLLIVTPALQVSKAGIPVAGTNKVAYYVFDSGGPDHFPLTTFTDEANIVVLFEGTLWELADSAHYSTGWMTTTNVNYHYYGEIIRDIRILQARGVKVLMNVDDAASWSTPTPFTAYDGTKYDYQQFATFIKTCAIDSLHLDGISLDIEHGATGNTNYIALIKEIGKYFGPLSSNSNSQIYAAAIYAGGAPGSVIGRSRDVAAYLNFVMDIAYFSPNYISRFNQWADSIGSSKTMVGVLNDYYDLSTATAAAAWQPTSSPKAGIMVFAANNLKSYTDAVFNALTIPQRLALMQNYPNPFNSTTVIEYQVSTPGNVSLKVYDVLGREVETLVNELQNAGSYYADFNGRNIASGVYFYRLISPGINQVRKMTLVK